MVSHLAITLDEKIGPKTPGGEKGGINKCCFGGLSAEADLQAHYKPNRIHHLVLNQRLLYMQVCYFVSTVMHYM